MRLELKNIICLQYISCQRVSDILSVYFSGNRVYNGAWEGYHGGLNTKESWYLSKIGAEKVLGELSRIGTRFMPEFSGLGEENKV